MSFSDMVRHCYQADLDGIKSNGLFKEERSIHSPQSSDIEVEFPVGSGRLVTLVEIADELRNRLASLYLRGKDGRRPSLGPSTLLQHDPHFRDHLLFNEYYHGETGAGLGASHQTGWSGLIALLLHPHRIGLPINGVR